MKTQCWELWNSWTEIAKQSKQKKLKTLAKIRRRKRSFKKMSNWEKVRSKQSGLASKKIFEEAFVANVNREERYRIYWTLSKVMKATKLPPLSKHQKKKGISWAKNYAKTNSSIGILWWMVLIVWPEVRPLMEIINTLVGSREMFSAPILAVKLLFPSKLMMIMPT